MIFAARSTADIPQFSFDQLAELAVFGWVVRIDAEQELLIARVEIRLSAQGGRMGPDIQTAPELIDVRLVEPPNSSPSTVSWLPMIQAGPRPELVTSNPAVAPAGKLIVSPRSGRTESRLCFRVAQATYADTTRDATAMTTPQIAMTVFASTETSQPGKRPGPRMSMPSDISSRATTTDANRGHYGRWTRAGLDLVNVLLTTAAQAPDWVSN